MSVDICDVADSTDIIGTDSLADSEARTIHTPTKTDSFPTNFGGLRESTSMPPITVCRKTPPLSEMEEDQGLRR